MFLCSRAVWICLGWVAGFALLCCRWSGFTIIIDRTLCHAGLVCFTGLVGSVWCLQRPAVRTIAAPLQFLALLIAIVVVSAILQYPAAKVARPLIDAYLVTFDRALGFDWPAWFVWVLQHPAALNLFKAVYLSLGLQSMLLCFLSWRQPHRVNVWLAANVLALACCLTVFVVWPAGGAFAYYQPAGIMSDYVAQFMGTRLGLINGLALGQMTGIIQFPSYHAAAAVLLAYAFASLPRWIAVPVVIVETMLTVSAVPIGGHHLVDVLAGVAVGTISLAVAVGFARASWRDPPRLLDDAEPVSSRSALPI